MKTNQEIYKYLAESLKRPEMFFLTKDALLSNVMTCFYFLGVDRSKHNVYAKFAPKIRTFFLGVDVFDEFVKEKIDTVDNASDKYWVNAIFTWVNRILSESHKNLVIELCEELNEGDEDDKTAQIEAV